jgi:glycosyltransferase involved in cell wall biosynthesis
MQPKSTVLLLGKLPPPYMGPAIATSILLQSGLNDHYKLVHFDTRLNTDIRSIGRMQVSKVSALVRQYISFSRYIKSYKPDLVLVPISQSKEGFLKDAMFILLAASKGSKVLVHLRGSEFREIYNTGSAAYRAFVRWILKKSMGAIVLGECLRPIFKGLVPDNAISSCPNGCNLVFPEHKKVSDSKVNILSIGNLQASKGILDILQAVLLLPASLRESIHIDVLGAWRDETTKSECLRLTEENSLPIRFIPSAESNQKAALLSRADIFFFTPRAPEGHPWVIVEALAAGLPIISTDRGAITESVIDGENGYIVPLKDPVAISERLKELIGDAGKRQRMGQDSRKRYESAYTEEKMVERLERIFRQTIQQEQ